MVLNQSKTKLLLINFTNNYQFSTRLKLKNENIEIVEQAKVLGTILTSNLKWDANCANLVKKFYARLQLLKKVAAFTSDKSELKQIYITFCRGILEHSCEVWGNNLTQENKDDLERCQKVAVQLIIQNYKSYFLALQELSLETLEQRRQKLSLRMAKKFVDHTNMKSLFPLHEKKHNMQTRTKYLYEVTQANTERFRGSAIIKMQAQLNEHYVGKKYQKHI